MHLARMLKDAGGVPGSRQPAFGVERGDALRLREPRVPVTGRSTLARVGADDSELVDALRAGDEAAFARIVSDWSRPMLALARGFVSTDASAEEVVQETWLAVIKGIDRFEGRSALRTWVYRILVNTAKSRGVREHRTLPVEQRGRRRRGPEPRPRAVRVRPLARRRRPPGPRTSPSRPPHWPRRGARRARDRARRAPRSPAHRDHAARRARDAARTRCAACWRSPRPTSGCSSTAPAPPSGATWRPTWRGPDMASLTLPGDGRAGHRRTSRAGSAGGSVAGWPGTSTTARPAPATSSRCGRPSALLGTVPVEHALPGGPGHPAERLPGPAPLTV